jgi:hypothetical protein
VANGLKLDPFGHIESVIYLDPQILNSAFQLCVAEQGLNRA